MFSSGFQWINKRCVFEKLVEKTANIGSNICPPDWFYFCSSLQDLILHEPNKFGSYLSTLLPVWLKIAKNKEKSINLRIKALNCIQTVTKAETQDLVPYKKEVINGLIPALDDHKRLVRQAATSARNSWCISWLIRVINTYNYN